MSGVETKTGENHFFFIRGIGVFEVMTGSEKVRIQILITQGFTVKFVGDKCKLFPTFSIPLINKKSDQTGMTREEENGVLEKQYMISKESEHEKFKTEFLNEHLENLNLSTNEPDWNVLILQAMSFKEYQDNLQLPNCPYINTAHIDQTKFQS
ncbi:hypothetical protein Hanom_Chr03g00240391 [Helianthus anomalus]